MGSRVRETNVIDNKKVVLKDELNSILPHTKCTSIAVGYFFISGLKIIIEPLQKVDKVRLLISNTTDKETSEALMEGLKSLKQVTHEIKRINFINDVRKETILKDSTTNIKKSLEYMNQTFDDKNVVQLLIEMLHTKKLEVRVYPKEKLHAKAYIFELRNTDLASGVGIVGSSNLSLSGISANSELNLKTLNELDVNKLLEWFDSLWEDGLEFTETFNTILTHSWAGRVYSPRDIFFKALYNEYKDRVDPEHKFDPVWEAEGPRLFPFQRHAVDQCITMIELYGGVIIGDVVGLGKTYVGTALLKYLQLQDYRPLIVCPPALVSMWEKFCAEYEVDAKIISRGKLTCDDYDLVNDYRYKDRDLVLVDESHHFKNTDSNQYENLQHFTHARDARVILLTATPYSNKADDIKNQILLFHPNNKTSIPPANETDLNTFFKLERKGEVDLVDLLRNIMIRRTRRYVLNQWGKRDKNNPKRRYLLVGNTKKYFPDRHMETLRYDINESYFGQYDSIVAKLDKQHLTLARYSPGLYLKPFYQNKEPYSDLKTTGPKLVRLVRSSLLKRMESSVKAFHDSIDRYIKTHKIFINALDNNVLPVGDLESSELYEAADPESDLMDNPEKLMDIIEKIKQKGKNRYDVKAFDIKQLRNDVRKDLGTFEEIMLMLKSSASNNDDKLSQLQKLIDLYRDKKIIIFTEFESTAKYIFYNLKWNTQESMELVTSTKDNVLHAARRFDPENNPSPTKHHKQKELTLLITTDVLAEGVNLQAGNVVINYDFHWNPVRLIQRVGRVDRIGSKNEIITVHNFLPDPKIEKDLKLEETVSYKIDEIHRIVGEDYTVLVKTEVINENDAYVIYKGEDTIFDREESDPLEPSIFEKLLIDVHANNPKLWEELRNLPDGIRSAKNQHSGGKLLLACSNGSQNNTITKYYVIDPHKRVHVVDSRTALHLLDSNDQSVTELPTNYDAMVAAGWEKFLSDIEQLEAGRNRSKLTLSQKKIINRLLKIARNPKYAKHIRTIEPLLVAFSMPIVKGKLNRELNRIRKADLNDDQLIIALGSLYRSFDLQKNLEQHEREPAAPKILYSEYLGN